MKAYFCVPEVLDRGKHYTLTSILFSCHTALSWNILAVLKYIIKLIKYIHFTRYAPAYRSVRHQKSIYAKGYHSVK